MAGSPETPPEGLTFEAGNRRLDKGAASWVKTDGRYCAECKARDGWMPRVDQTACPMCYGEDPYGQGSYCGECEFCCGC